MFATLELKFHKQFVSRAVQKTAFYLDHVGFWFGVQNSDSPEIVDKQQQIFNSSHKHSKPFLATPVSCGSFLFVIATGLVFSYITASGFSFSCLYKKPNECLFCF